MSWRPELRRLLFIAQPAARGLAAAVAVAMLETRRASDIAFGDVNDWLVPKFLLLKIEAEDGPAVEEMEKRQHQDERDCQRTCHGQEETHDTSSTRVHEAEEAVQDENAAMRMLDLSQEPCSSQAPRPPLRSQRLRKACIRRLLRAGQML